MKKILLILLFLLFNFNLSYAEYYEVYVKRVEHNLYKDLNSGIYIVTKWCYEYSYGEDAILKYEDYSYDNKLIFDSGEECAVDKLLK